MVRIATFFHDAAVSNNILPILKKYKYNYEWYIYVYKDSPAFKIFTASRITVIELENITQALTELHSDILLVGTSWQNKAHLEFIKIAKMLHIPSIATMDHWVSYRERFTYPHESWRENLPDFVTVNDHEAYITAQKFNLPNIISLKFYSLLEDIEIFKKSTIKERDATLFISEPTKKVALTTYEDENYWGFSEFDVIEQICKSLDSCDTSSLTIRLHPSDEEHKYDYLIKKYPNIEITMENPYKKPLIESLCEYKIIIGIDGFVLFEAMVLGKLSISLMPSSKRGCVVPIFEQNKIKVIDKNMKLSDFKKDMFMDEIKSFGIDFATMIKQIVK